MGCYDSEIEDLTTFPQTIGAWVDFRVPDSVAVQLFADSIGVCAQFFLLANARGLAGSECDDCRAIMCSSDLSASILTAKTLHFGM